MSLGCSEPGSCAGRNAKRYTAGGARGALAHGIAEDVETTKGAISSRFETGTIARLGDDVASAEPAVEQSGQMCEAEGGFVQSGHW